MAALVTAGTLFVDDDRVLLVHRSGREHEWDIPGGPVLPGRSPAVTASAELYEDLGVDRFVRNLLVVDWVPGPESDEFGFVFDGGRLRAADVRLALGRNGLDRCEWVPLDQLADYVPESFARRLARAVKARADATVLTLEHGETI
ncbi:NUDIX domain-containing protein [Actinophytocola sp.]|uniref:NUDIX domain-containing protein n=1 Tax=Actinophytocola sp. TaxID=1872138 RepID=UPI002D7E3E45|nr:NUDIX domain-containing protein [Actinophytocola sp.]HET9139041.1 NUDIX domain-containing protein [Actinophytocola sp.]